MTDERRQRLDMLIAHRWAVDHIKRYVLRGDDLADLKKSHYGAGGPDRPSVTIGGSVNGKPLSHDYITVEGLTRLHPCSDFKFKYWDIVKEIQNTYMITIPIIGQVLPDGRISFNKDTTPYSVQQTLL